ncbi:MAG: hypothetical protein R6V85_08650 [Polyangia bacterium]
MAGGRESSGANGAPCDDETRCPKCGEPRRGESCPKCGLVFARYDPELIDREVPRRIRELWSHVEQAWDDRSRHALFVEQALAAGQGGYAASCYRRKGDDPRAREQLELITSRLEEMLAVTAAPQEERPGARGHKVLWLLALLLAAAMLGLVLFAMKP